MTSHCAPHTPKCPSGASGAKPGKAVFPVNEVQGTLFVPLSFPVVNPGEAPSLASYNWPLGAMTATTLLKKLKTVDDAIDTDSESEQEEELTQDHINFQFAFQI